MEEILLNLIEKIGFVLGIIIFLGIVISYVGPVIFGVLTILFLPLDKFKERRVEKSIVRSECELKYGKVITKNRTYDKSLQDYQYTTSIRLDNGSVIMKQDYDTYMRYSQGERVTLAYRKYYDKNNKVVKSTIY